MLQVMLHSPEARLPVISVENSIGYDLSSAMDVCVPARGRVLVPTKMSIILPHGTYGRIAPRSGLALKHSIDVCAGVIDPGYTGEIRVLLANHSDIPYFVKTYERIAQLILEVAVVAPVVQITQLPETLRGEGGFGSSG